MSDLSDRSSLWWERVEAVSVEAYGRWQASGPLEKSLVECRVLAELQDPRYARLESRALGMLLEGVPDRIKDELVAIKGMTCANAVFRILLAYQPGGLGEGPQTMLKSALISFEDGIVGCLEQMILLSPLQMRQSSFLASTSLPRQ